MNVREYIMGNLPFLIVGNAWSQRRWGREQTNKTTMIAERRDVVICCNTKRRYKSDHRAPGGDNYDGDNSKKTVNKKKTHQTIHKNTWAKENNPTNRQTDHIISITSPKTKESQQKDEETHVISRSNTTRKHDQHKQQNCNILFMLKTSKTRRKKTVHRQNSN